MFLQTRDTLTFPFHVSNHVQITLFWVKFMSEGGVSTFVRVTQLDILNEKFGHFPKIEKTEPDISSQSMISSSP